MKREVEEIPDELNQEFMLRVIDSELLIKVAKEEIDIWKLVREELSNRGIDDQRNWIGFDKAKKYTAEEIAARNYNKPSKAKSVRIKR